ncbi:DUF4956 domain-containing protein [Marinitoga arctica]
MNILLKDLYNIFLEQFKTNIPLSQILFSLILSFFEGLIIYIVYKKTYQGVVYVKSFNVSLVILTLITSMIISAISSNFVLSFGMVGALSIVRFRTAIKDPLDTVYMFWAISIGLVNGGGFYLLGFIGTIFISIIILFLIKFHRFSTPYLLIISFNNIENEEKIDNFIKSNFSKYKVRSKIINDIIEITYEIKLKDSKIINDLKEIAEIEKITLISYSGDYIETV